MGWGQASDFGDAVRAGQVSLDVALEYHLGSNHFPPIHSSFIPVAKEAIEKAGQGDYESIIEMPNGLKRSVASIVEGMHLDPFIAEMEFEIVGVSR